MSPLHLTPDGSVKNAKGSMAILYPMLSKSITTHTIEDLLGNINGGKLIFRQIGTYVEDGKRYPIGTSLNADGRVKANSEHNHNLDGDICKKFLGD